MYISRVKLQNWRNFLSIDVPLGIRTFIVGANATGKSNFLDVFCFLRDIVQKQQGGGFSYAVQKRGGVSKIRTLNARNHPEIEITIEISDFGNSSWCWKYTLGFKQESTGNHETFLTKEEIWKKDEKGETLLLSRPTVEDKKDRKLLTQTALEQLSQNQEFRNLADIFQNINYYHLIPQLLRHPDLFRVQTSLNAPYGHDFLEKITQTPVKTRDRFIKKINDTLIPAIPHLKDLEFQLDSSGHPHLRARYDHWRPNAGFQTEEQFSDGTLRLIALLWTLLENKGIALFEEPELSLHNDIIEKLPGLFSLIQKKKKQYIITTHSDLMLTDKGISLSEILVLQSKKDGTNCFQASSIPEWRELLKEGMTPSEIVMPATKVDRISELYQPYLPGFEHD